jgi:hypothetical protein
MGKTLKLFSKAKTEDDKKSWKKESVEFGLRENVCVNKSYNSDASPHSFD